jgi:hypothetical protein
MWGFVLSILRYLLVSLVVSAIGFVATVSLITGKFPPSMSQIKAVKKNMDTVLALKSQSGGDGNLAAMLKRIQGGQVVPAANNTNQPSGGSNFDPEMEDVKALLEHRKNQAALSNAISGEATFSSSPPPSPGAAPQESPQEVHGLSERVRKLEDLVAHMHSQLQKIDEQLKRLNSSSAPAVQK